MKKIFKLLFVVIFLFLVTGCGRAKIIEIDVKSVESFSLYDGTNEDGYSFSYMSGESLIFYDEWEGITKKSYEISIDDSFNDKLIGILNKYKYCVEDRELEEGTDSMSGFASYFLVYVNGDEEGYYVVEDEREKIISDIIDLTNTYEKTDIIENF